MTTTTGFVHRGLGAYGATWSYRVLAVTSHLPHLIAFTICGTADDLAEETREAVLKFLYERHRFVEAAE